MSLNPTLETSLSPNPESSHHPNVLLMATGSVASIKLPLLVSTLLQYRLNLQVIVTPTAEKFLSRAELTGLGLHVKIWRDEDEWLVPWKRGDPVLHIELRKWADMMLIAPLSANSLAAMATGLCGGLGMCVVRAWDTHGKVGGGGAKNEDSHPKKKKMIAVAPAMNSHMYVHPLTEQHLCVLRGWNWVHVLDPVSKELACGDIGIGGMMEVEEIVRYVVDFLGILRKIEVQ